jgi:hypothetical protein
MEITVDLHFLMVPLGQQAHTLHLVVEELVPTVHLFLKTTQAILVG